MTRKPNSCGVPGLPESTEATFPKRSSSTKSQSGSIIFVESGAPLYYVRVPEYIRRVPIGEEANFSVRADLMHTGSNGDMANSVQGSYVTTEYLGTLETDVFEIGPGHYVHVEQHRKLSDHVYQMGETETISWAAEAGILLEEAGAHIEGAEEAAQ